MSRYIWRIFIWKLKEAIKRVPYEIRLWTGKSDKWKLWYKPLRAQYLQILYNASLSLFELFLTLTLVRWTCFAVHSLHGTVHNSPFHKENKLALFTNISEDLSHGKHSQFPINCSFSYFNLASERLLWFQLLWRQNEQPKENFYKWSTVVSACLALNPVVFASSL